MSTSDRRARDKDRDAAIKVVEAAWADGQIVEADRDKRVEELQRAQTLDEIDMFTRGLGAAPTYRTDPVDVEPESPEPAPAMAAAPVQYGPPMSAGSAGTATGGTPVKVPKGLLVVGVVIVLFIGLAMVGGVLTLFDSATESASEGVLDSPTYAHQGKKPSPATSTCSACRGTTTWWPP